MGDAPIVKKAGSTYFWMYFNVRNLKTRAALYIAASLLPNRFENLFKIFRVHGCKTLYHGFTCKKCGNFFKNERKWLLQRFVANGNGNDKFAANEKELWSDMHKSLHGGGN